MISKTEFRTAALARRVGRSRHEIEAANLAWRKFAWHEFLPDGTRAVSAYAAMKEEPPTEGLREALRELGVLVAVPIMGPNRSLAWGYDTDPMTVNSFGIAEPPPSHIDLNRLPMMLIPALSAGLDGSRIGRGAGYYDRALSQVKRSSQGGPLRVCILFDDEVSPTVPHEPHDEKLDFILTPSRLLDVRS
jgi:5-formyltetrahydrofolate cyclo-ligase